MLYKTLNLSWLKLSSSNRKIEKLKMRLDYLSLIFLLGQIHLLKRPIEPVGLTPSPLHFLLCLCFPLVIWVFPSFFIYSAFSTSSRCFVIEAHLFRNYVCRYFMWPTSPPHLCIMNFKIKRKWSCRLKFTYICMHAYIPLNVITHSL